MKTALIHHPIYQKHDTGFGHPETPRRYEAVMNALRRDEALWQSLLEITPEQASQGTIQAAHTKEHFRRVAGAFENGLEMLDADTAISMQSFDAALYGAGGVCRAVDAVMTGEATSEITMTAVMAEPVLHRHAELAETARTMFLVLAAVAIAGTITVWKLKDRAKPGMVVGALAVYGIAHLLGCIVLANAAHAGGRVVHEFGTAAWAKETMPADD